MELLGVAIDDKLNFEKHIAKICRKVFFCLTDWKSYHKEGLSKKKKKKQRKKKGKKIKAVLELQRLLKDSFTETSFF